MTLPENRPAPVISQSLRHGSAVPPAYASGPSVAARHLPTLWGVTLYTREALRWAVGASIAGPLNLALLPNRTGEHCSPLRSLTRWFRRGRRCGVAQRSMPHWGIEPHECASSAGWRRSLCAAKRRRPVQPIKRQHLPLTTRLLCITIYLTPWYYKVAEGRDSLCLTRRSCARGCWRGAS